MSMPLTVDTAGFSVAIAAAVLIYKLRRKRKPTGLKQFQ
jgi:tRNA G18 (ribose-2'-O)-methylase SpoU